MLINDVLMLISLNSHNVYIQVSRRGCK